MPKKTTPPPKLLTHLEMLREAHQIISDLLEGFEKQKKGHAYPQAVYEKAEEWVDDHDFS